MMIASSMGPSAFMALTYFMNPSVSGSRPHDDSFILWDRQLFGLGFADLLYESVGFRTPST